MKHHKYYNTIWTERDQEFYWDGVKFGFAIGSILAMGAVACIYDAIQFIKSLKDEETR